jgi:hypothetical protein
MPESGPATPAPPRRLKRNGRGARLWREVTREFEFDALEAELLAEACATLDLIDALPASEAVELRQQRIVLSRLLGQLALPRDGSAAAGLSIVSGPSVRGRRAAEARWRGRAAP